MSTKSTLALKTALKGAVSVALAAGACDASAAYAAAEAAGRGEAASPSDAVSADDIVVTATKNVRGSTVFKAPISITAISPEQLAATHFRNISDIGKLIPNAYLNGAMTFPGQAAFSIRG